MSIHRQILRTAALVLLVTIVAGPARWSYAGAVATPAADAQWRLFLPIARTPPAPMPYWGMNLYLTKVERRGTGDNLPLLADLARQAGVRWTREELVWALIEPGQNDLRPIYDDTLRLASQKGFSVIGMLLTTPDWARDRSCRPTQEAYWCPPADAASYARFAGWMAERYDGDGTQDAPGSPRVAAWEIWNEPNDLGNWPEIGADKDTRKRRYGEMLIAAYQAIKAADPSALVLIGGTYIFDGGCANNICDGIYFLTGPNGVFRQLPQARQAFDVFATHPYASPTAPDALDRPRKVLIEGTTRESRGWLDSAPVGRPDAQLWITELGWCVAPGNCPGDLPVSAEQQANYLVRSMVIAQHNGAQHVSWFQFEDAFNNPGRVWGNAAIVGNYDGSGYGLKPAYYAYRTLATQLADAVVAGNGPLHSHRYDPAQPYVNSGGTYDYRYQRGAAVIDVLWRPNDTLQVDLPVEPGRQVIRIDRDGAQSTLTPSGGVVRLTLSERPVLIVQQ